jgi:hypothetical protein
MLSKNETALLAVGGAIVLLGIYVVFCETQSNSQLRYETPAAVAGGFNLVFDELDAGCNYFHPNYSVPGQTQIFMRQRYPNVSGHNISTLIHQGLDALSRPAPQDNDWITRPPGEVMF